MKAKFVFEKFEEDSNVIQDMGIGSNLNFEKEALKTIRNKNIDDINVKRDKWQVYLKSLERKSISGVFEQVRAAREKPIKKTNRITFIISTFESYLKGTEVYLYNKKTEATSSHDATYDIYKVLPEEYYLIK